VTQHPYLNLPDYCYWRRSIADVGGTDVDPVVAGKFNITPHDRVATAGSCFAQHIARHLSKGGFNYFVTETANPVVPPYLAERFGYGLFSARYGNIYTSRQFIQLLHRAYGMFVPADDVWINDEGGFIDPFRPQIQPAGFASRYEYDADRCQHFAAVRRAVEECDVFVFTLGLTEGWVFRTDGAAYPLCPGVAGGRFDETLHQFLNLRPSNVVADMQEALRFIKSKNNKVRFILTVSPVPLIATAENRSVLVSTAYSKSVLRVACEELAMDDPDVAYFPSYEIITGSYNRGRYFAADLRSVTEEGVAHVMRLFMKHYAKQTEVPSPSLYDADNEEAARDRAAREQLKAIENVVAVMCDEERLDTHR
jgi:GSCFA family